MLYRLLEEKGDPGLMRNKVYAKGFLLSLMKVNVAFLRLMMKICISCFVDSCDRPCWLGIRGGPRHRKQRAFHASLQANRLVYNNMSASSRTTHGLRECLRPFQFAFSCRFTDELDRDFEHLHTRMDDISVGIATVVDAVDESV